MESHTPTLTQPDRHFSKPGESSVSWTDQVSLFLDRLPSGGLSRHAHPAGGDGLWGTEGEVPSFLYAMPIRPGRVFLEETCLVSKPALPFAVLKRRLYRRLRALNIKVGPPPSSFLGIKD